MSMFASQAATSIGLGLHSFKAGKLNRVEGTNRVKPDPRKGLVYLEEIDELLHLYWKDRQSGRIEDDLIIFPDEAELVKVQESPSGRVYALKFSSSSQITFFWMQEKESSNDEADVKRVNQLIADPKSPAPAQAPGSGTGQGIPSIPGMPHMSDILARSNLDLSATAQAVGMSQQQLMEVIGSADLQGLTRSEDSRASPFAATGGTANTVMNRGDALTTQPRDPSNTNITSGLAMPSAGQQAGLDSTALAANTASSYSNDVIDRIVGGITVSPSTMETIGSAAIETLTALQLQALLSNTQIKQRLFPHLTAVPSSLGHAQSIMSSTDWKQAIANLSYTLRQSGVSVFETLGISSNSQNTGSYLRAVADRLQEHEADVEQADRMEE